MAEEIVVESPIEKESDKEAAADHAAEMDRLGIKSSISEKKEEPKAPEPKVETPEPEKKEPETPEKKETPEPEKKEPEGEKVIPPKTEEKPERPLKYIPVPVFQDEKKKRKDAEDALAAVTKELETLRASGKSSAEVTKEKETLVAEVRTIAEGMGADENAIQKLIDIASQGKLTPEERAKFNEVIKQSEERKQQDEAKAKAEAEVAHFNKEWDVVAVGKMKEFSADATEKQLAEAKAKLDELAHSEEFYRFPIDYVIFKNAELFKTILTNPKKKTAEGGALGKGNAPAQRTPIDYSSMTPAKIAQIEAEFNAQGEEPLKITREGEQV